MRDWIVSFIAACMMVGRLILVFSVGCLAVYGWHLAFHGHPWIGAPIGIIPLLGILTVLIHMER
jgi:hypothetical protein